MTKRDNYYKFGHQRTMLIDENLISNYNFGLQCLEFKPVLYYKILNLLFEKISNYLLQPLSGFVLEGTLMQVTQNIVTLADLKSGESATINSLKAGRNINARLSTLGFTPGVLIFMTHNYGHGPIVVTVRDTRIALGRGEAEMIFVKRERE